MLRPIIFIDINAQVTGNKKLCKIYFKKIFFQNVLVYLIFFTDTITSFISSNLIACDNMYVQHLQFLQSIEKKTTIFSIRNFFL